MKLFRIISVSIIAICLSACQLSGRNPEPQIDSNNSAGTPTPTELPIQRTITREAGIERFPTVAACMAVPENITVEISEIDSLKVEITISGLQPGESPVFQLIGRSERFEYQYEQIGLHPLGENGRFNTTFNFRSIESPETYQFEGKLIHSEGVICFDVLVPLGESALDSTPAAITGSQPVLTLTDYPPSNTPYLIEEHDFWLVHTPEGQLFIFLPFSPQYKEVLNRSSNEQCRFAWVAANERFTDPCSGDEWSLTGKLNLEHSTELWSNQNLDQYPISNLDGRLFVQTQSIVQGEVAVDSGLVSNSQFGVTVTAVKSTFSPLNTAIDFLVQVDPLWQMDASDSYPQQALNYPFFPDSLVDDQGRAIAPTLSEGTLAVSDSANGGLKQTMHNYWEIIPEDSQSVTARTVVNLNNLYRSTSLPITWSDHQEEDSWLVNELVEIGHSAIQIEQIEWIETRDDGTVSLRLTVTDASPEELEISCLHLDSEDPIERSCIGFESEHTIITAANDIIDLHLRATVVIKRPFQLTLAVNQ